MSGLYMAFLSCDELCNNTKQMKGITKNTKKEYFLYCLSLTIMGNPVN